MPSVNAARCAGSYRAGPRGSPLVRDRRVRPCRRVTRIARGEGMGGGVLACHLRGSSNIGGTLSGAVPTIPAKFTEIAADAVIIEPLRLNRRAARKRLAIDSRGPAVLAPPRCCRCPSAGSCGPRASRKRWLALGSFTASWARFDVTFPYRNCRQEPSSASWCSSHDRSWSDVSEFLVIWAYPMPGGPARPKPSIIVAQRAGIPFKMRGKGGRIVWNAGYEPAGRQTKASRLPSRQPT